MERVKVKGLTTHSVSQVEFEKAIWFLKFRKDEGHIIVPRSRWDDFVDYQLDYKEKKTSKLLLHLHNSGYVDADLGFFLIINEEKVNNTIKEFKDRTPCYG